MLAGIKARERKAPPPHGRSLAFAGAVLLRRTDESFNGVSLADADVQKLYDAIEDRWLVSRGPNKGQPLAAGTFRIHHQARVYEDIAYELRSFVQALATPGSASASGASPAHPASLRDGASLLSGWAQAGVYLSTSPAAYREQILAAEENASRIDRLPKRISVVFKDEQTVLEIAQKRFGRGSRMINHYVDEHRARSKNFLEALSSGLLCREIYNKSELLAYVASRKHSANVELEVESMGRTLTRWRNAILNYPSYVVALTEDPLPFKYEIVDAATVVLHEVVGVTDISRLNGIFLRSAGVAETFQHDFDIIWERVAPEFRDPDYVLQWLNSMLDVKIATV